MADLAARVATLRRIVHDRGVSGLTSALAGKLGPVVRPPIEYARLAPAAVALLARHGRPDLFITVGEAGIGDDLLCTAIFRELRERGELRVWAASRFPELYDGNPDVAVVTPLLPRLGALLRHLGARVVHPWYTSYHPAYDRDDPMPEQHLISVMCQKVGITGTVRLRPYVSLTAGEARRGQRVDRQVAIQSSGLHARHSMRNKNWFPERYQGVVSALRGTYNFVQLGSPEDPPLDGALDLRGRTSLRETAAVLSASLAFVGQVGMLMHLARAVDCRSVIVYGGRETPAQSGYPCNENLYSAVACSPCWKLNACPYDRVCLRAIDVDDVLARLAVQVEKHGAPLECDTATITRDLIAYNNVRHAEADSVHAHADLLLYS